MNLEEIPEEEYQEYLGRLREKPINSLNYTEMSDLASAEFEDACNKKDWNKLKIGFRFLWLITNLIEGKADATKTVLLKLARGEELGDLQEGKGGENG